MNETDESGSESSLQKILIVTYDWPPRNSIATHRPYSWARYWAEQGLEVTVLTAKKKFFDQPLDLELPKIDAVKVVETDYKTMIPLTSSSQNKNVQRWIESLKKLKAFISTVSGLEYDVRSNWAGTSDQMIKEIGTDFDIIISTYGPDSSHIIASKFKKINPSLYWVADYRDLWSQNVRKKDSYILRKIIKRREIQVVGSADLFTTVSMELAEKLKHLTRKMPEVIFNGFDGDIIPKKYNEQLKIKNGCVNIIYTGRIYPNKRNPLPLIKSIESLIDKKMIISTDVKIKFYGGNTKIINAEIGILKYPEIIEHYGHVPRSVALQLQQSADLLLLLESGDDDSKGFLTGKIFEYIGAGRPIISIGSSPNSAIARVLKETQCGVCYGDNSEVLAEDIFSYLRGELPVWYKPDISAIEFYSRKKQAQILLEKIKNSYVKNHKNNAYQ